MLLKEVGLRIQELRKERLKLTQSEFASMPKRYPS